LDALNARPFVQTPEHFSNRARPVLHSRLYTHVIAAEIDANEPASCNDLAHFASHRGAQLAHSWGIKSADIQIH
jgi:hypothetical protein